jgi:phosphoribosylformylglycinamidine cyclo-ligase
VGVVERSKIIDGKSIKPGDVILGLGSNGAHSNGYSLIRKIISTRKADLNLRVGGKALKNLILAPTRIYVKPVLALAKKVPLKGLAHITGGGLVENIPRVLSAGLCARIDSTAWPTPPLFAWLKQQGNIADGEMHRVFNCGIGMIIVVDAQHAAKAQSLLTRAGERVWRIGEVARRARGAPQTVVR